MDIGTGIVLGCVILGGIASLWKIFPNKKDNPGKYVSQKLCDTRFDMLNQTMINGFKDIKEDIKGLHKRIDKILEK